MLARQVIKCYNKGWRRLRGIKCTCVLNLKHAHGVSVVSVSRDWPITIRGYSLIRFAERPLASYPVALLALPGLSRQQNVEGPSPANISRARHFLWSRTLLRWFVRSLCDTGFNVL